MIAINAFDFQHYNYFAYKNRAMVEWGKVYIIEQKLVKFI